MSAEEIVNIINDTIPGNDDFDLSDLSSINETIVVSLEIDRDNLENPYYYEITIDNLIESNVSEDTLRSLVSKGWKYKEQKKSLIRKIF